MTRSLVRSGACALSAWCCAWLADQSVLAGQVRGQARVPAVVRVETDDVIALRGAALFVCPPGEGLGISCHCPDGGFAFTAPPGEYRVLLEPAEPYRRGQFFSELKVGDQEQHWNAELTPDYNCTFNTMTEWNQNPWAWGTVFEQTFIARGTSITHVALKLAGVKQELGRTTLEVSVRDAGGKAVGPARTVEAKPIDDLYVTWSSGEVPTEPGKTYTLRVGDVDGKKPVGLFVKREYGYGYAYGELTIDGKPNESDGYFHVGSNADGTILTYAEQGQDPAGAAGGECAQAFVAQGTSLAGVSVPLIADAQPAEMAIAVHKGGADGPRVGPGKKMKPVPVKEKHYLVGIACGRDEVPLQPGEKYTLVVSAGGDARFAAVAAAKPGGAEARLAMRIYEHAAKKLEFRLPPPPEPRGWEFAELLPTPNSGFEKGDESDWQSAWGGARAFTAVAGADYKPEKFSGDARRPHDGAFCGIIAAEGKEARDLIRRSFSWPHTVGKGLFHARVWVASSDNADQLKHPLRVRLCVSDHGSVDAGNVAWSRAVISPGKWTLLQCRPEVPKTRNLTAFLLIEGGGQGEESYLKIDDLEIVVDEK